MDNLETLKNEFEQLGQQIKALEEEKSDFPKTMFDTKVNYMKWITDNGEIMQTSLSKTTHGRYFDGNFNDD